MLTEQHLNWFSEKAIRASPATWLSVFSLFQHNSLESSNQMIGARDIRRTFIHCRWRYRMRRIKLKYAYKKTPTRTKKKQYHLNYPWYQGFFFQDKHFIACTDVIKSFTSTRKMIPLRHINAEQQPNAGMAAPRIDKIKKMMKSHRIKLIFDGVNFDVETAISCYC